AHQYRDSANEKIAPHSTFSSITLAHLRALSLVAVMGACRSVWRLGGCAWVVLAWIGALLLGSSLALPPPATCPKRVSPLNLIQTQYRSIPGADTGFMSGVLLYEVGFLVCAVIGIVYIILMPLVGFCLACCRCCGHCGGHMYQEQTKAVHCHRRGLYWATLLTTLVILAGNICMFFSNQLLKVSVKDSSVELSNTLDNLQTYLTAVPQRRLEGPLNPALKSVRDMAKVMNRTSVLLVGLNSTLTQLQSDVTVVQANVTSVRDRINSTLRNPDCAGCSAYQSELQKLTFDTTITIPSLNELQLAVNFITKADLNSKGEDFFASIPQRVTNDTRDIVQNTLGEAQRYIDMYSPEAEKVEMISWGVGIILSCVVLLVVVCNLLGLFLGPVGLSPQADPKERSGTADCGGTFLMAGAGLSFLFSWLFMLVVLLLFIVGGNVYTLVCQPWRSGQLLQYKEEIQQHFDSNEIKLPTITLLTPEIISSINLTETAGMLDQLATVQEAGDLRGIQSDIVRIIIPQLTQLNSTIGALSVIVSEINESRKFLDCQMGYFMAYADWANLTITQQIGLCGPVAKAVDSAEVIVCSNMMESLNAFCFSLGWCMIFLVPSIIFSIKLAKFYRRMKHSDVYENHIAMNIRDRARVKPY
ncbi:unnamed protein product, partial [Coregonus sp. 'balchen']